MFEWCSDSGNLQYRSQTKLPLHAMVYTIWGRTVVYQEGVWQLSSLVTLITCYVNHMPPTPGNGI